MILTEARASLAAHESAYAARQAHDATLRAHHAAKPAPPAGLPPTKPATPLPTGEQIDAANRVQLDARRAEGAAQAQAAQLVSAKGDLAVAEARLKAATVEAERIKHLVAACRRAPGEVAAAQIAALGDMEGVEVRFAGEDRGARDPYVTVSYRGIPYDALSGGQRVLVDLLLRRGLRTAAGLSALPLVVDDVVALNAGAGPWPEVAGASIWLVTTDPAGGAA